MNTQSAPPHAGCAALCGVALLEALVCPPSWRRVLITSLWLRFFGRARLRWFGFAIIAHQISPSLLFTPAAYRLLSAGGCGFFYCFFGRRHAPCGDDERTAFTDSRCHPRRLRRLAQCGGPRHKESRPACENDCCSYKICSPFRKCHRPFSPNLYCGLRFRPNVRASQAKWRRVQAVVMLEPLFKTSQLSWVWRANPIK